MKRLITLVLALSAVTASATTQNQVPCYLSNSTTKCFKPVATGSGGTNQTIWTAGSVPFLSSSTQFGQDNANLFYDSTNHWLRVGGNNNLGSGSLEVSRPAATGTGIISTIYGNGVGGGGGSHFIAEEAGGTAASPTAVGNNALIANYAVRAYDGTAWSGNTAGWNVLAAENWAPGAHGSFMLWRTTPIGSITNAVRMLLDSTGFLGIGTGSTLPVPSMLSVGSGSPFQVDGSGDIAKIHGAATSWPSSNAAGHLSNNGSGSLSWAADLIVPGSVSGSSIIVGSGVNFADGINSSTLGGDQNNVGTGCLDSIVGGGFFNQVVSSHTTCSYSDILGGDHNLIGASHSVILGGQTNEVANPGGASVPEWDVIGGGQLNTEFQPYEFTGGGQLNHNAAAFATISGGQLNSTVNNNVNPAAGSTSQAIGGGASNVVAGNLGVISGGFHNFVSGGTGAIAGGNRNAVTGGGQGFAMGSDAWTTDLSGFAEGQGVWAAHANSYALGMGARTVAASDFTFGAVYDGVFPVATPDASIYRLAGNAANVHIGLQTDQPAASVTNTVDISSANPAVLTITDATPLPANGTTITLGTAVAGFSQTGSISFGGGGNNSFVPTIDVATAVNAGSQVTFTATGAGSSTVLPAGLAPGIPYFVVSGGTSFTVARTPGGTEVQVTQTPGANSTTINVIVTGLTTSTRYFVVGASGSTYNLSYSYGGPAIPTYNSGSGIVATQRTYANGSAQNRLALHTTNATHQSQSVSVAAPSTLTTSWNMVLPTTAGAGGQLLQTDGSGNTTWTNSLYWDSADQRLGIGTSTPTRTLEVAGDILSNKGAAGQVYIDQDSNGRRIYSTKNLTVTTDAGFTYLSEANGRFGVGTISPAAQMTVIGNGTGVANIGDVGIGNFTGLNFLATLTSTNFNLAGAAGEDFYVNRDTGRNIRFRESGSTDQMMIASGGNVGIGTTSPGAKLDVAGTTKLGSAGVAFTAMGACSVGSFTPSTTPANVTCTGVPATTGVAVTCTASDAFSTPAGDALYCRATGTADQLACNTTVVNVTAVTLACSWVQP